MTVVEKKERAKLANEITSKQMMRSSKVNGNIIQGIHDKTNFGENDLGESIKLDLKSLVDEMESVSEQVKNGLYHEIPDKEYVDSETTAKIITDFLEK